MNMMALNNNKMLLVYPLGYRAEAAAHDISRIAGIMPPIGLISIAAFLERRGIKTTIVDCYARPNADTLIRDYLLSNKPAYIAFSCTTSNFLDGIRIARAAKSIQPDIKTVFGGAHVSALKKKVLYHFPDVDFAIVGEGEQTLADLVERGHDGAGSIKGIVLREDKGKISFTGYRKDMLDLDTLPFPAYEKLQGYPQAYKMPIFNYPENPGTSCISSRGCPYQCSYCDRSVFQRSFRYNSAIYLYEHLKYLKERFRIRHLAFYDDQFTFNRKRVAEFTQMLIDRPLGITFNCVVRAEHIDFELLLQMKAAGCWMISLGIETGDPDLLARHRQNPDLDLLAQKIYLIKKAGIRVKGLLMIGLPGETEASIKKSMDYVFSLPIDDINLAKFTPFPGSPIYENINELGKFDEDWEQMDCMNFQFIPKGITKQKLEEHFIKFYKTYYTRPATLFNYFSMLWRSPDSWKRFILNLGDFLKFAKSNKRFR